MEPITTQPNCNKNWYRPPKLAIWYISDTDTQENYWNHDYNHMGYDGTVW